MGIFAALFSAPIGKKTKAEMVRLEEWNRVHFPEDVTPNKYEAFIWSIPFLNQRNVRRYMEYQTESGTKISLAKIRLGNPFQSDSYTILDRLKSTFIDSSEITLPQFLYSYHEILAAQMQLFQENLVKLRGLSKNIQKDDLFQEIDHVFRVKLQMLHNELQFCKFKHMEDRIYCQDTCHKWLDISDDLKSLNSDFPTICMRCLRQSTNTPRRIWK